MEESAYGTRVEEATNCCGLPLEAARFSAWDQFPLPRSCQEEDLLVALALKLKSRAHGTSLRAVTPTPLACKGRGSRDPRRAPSLLAKTDVRLAPSWILEQGLTRQASSELSGAAVSLALRRVAAAGPPPHPKQPWLVRLAAPTFARFQRSQKSLRSAFWNARTQ